ncbi:hypothetical protein [Rhodospirillaceae bacterium SYSU D60014]|uniref:hypothetical protein n=1 Tax=Virgifigura deserti TaxID=2268457 RepID=UPI000E666D3C
MFAEPMTFPSRTPVDMAPVAEAVVFDPHRHLALERPVRAVPLEALGYSEEDIAACPSRVAITAPFRLLSDEGASALLEVCRQLRLHRVSCERIENMVRGGTYRSRFLRDLCLCPEVTAFLSDVFGAPLAPHTMPLQLGHLNFAPDDLSRAVDKWHHDTVGIDYVMMVSDPATVRGGAFQYFLGTKTEAAALAAEGRTPPEDRVVSVPFARPGEVVLMQGNMVVHRGAKLEQPTERITMVNAYVPRAIGLPDPTRFPDLRKVDPHHVLFPEWARHKAWLARGKLDRLIEELPFTTDRAFIIAALREAISDIDHAITDLEDETDGGLVHYGG